MDKCDTEIVTNIRQKNGKSNALSLRSLAMKIDDSTIMTREIYLACQWMRRQRPVSADSGVAPHQHELFLLHDDSSK